MSNRILKKTRRSNCFWFMLMLMAWMSLSNTNIYAADGCTAVNFRGAREYTIGQYPFHLATGDFNGDGKADIAATDYYGNSVRVAFGDGVGSFASNINVPVGTTPVFIAAGDMNNDGKLDLVTSNYNSNNVSVLLNNGAGGFTTTSYSAGVGPQGLALGDFNSDNKLDVAVANPTGNALVLLYNDGTGGLGAPGFVVLASGSTPREVVAADFNNDGKTDLASANESTSKVSVLLGLGTSGFAAPTDVTVPFSQALKAIAVGDVTGDGNLDLVTAAAFNSDRVNVLAGNGAGSFVFTVAISTTTYMSDVELRDINSDGKLDILTDGYSAIDANAIATVIYGNGLSSVSTSQDRVLPGSGSNSIALADLNSDGKPDLVSNYGTTIDAGLSISFNDGAGKIESAERVTASPNLSSAYASPVLADFNADGRLDLAVGQPNGVTIALSLSNGNMGTPTNYFGGPTLQLVAGDFNGDGKPDLAAVINNSVNLAVYLNNGSGGFNTPVNYNIGGAGASLVTGDFNSDGKLDLVVASRDLHAIRVFTGNGSGAFLLTNSINVNANPYAIVAGDFNNDGKLDVITGNGCDAGGCLAKLITFFAGDGAGSFALPTDVFNLAPTGFSPQGLATADFNGDGRLDLLMASINSASAPQIAFNTGGGGFATPTPLATTSVSVVAAGDINGDGKPDVVVSRGSGTALQFFLNRGASNFDPPVTYTGLTNMNGIVIGDVNSDGKRDVVFSSPSGAWRLLNKCGLMRGGQTTDFDGDGITDLSVFRPSTGTWYIIQSSDNAFRAIPFGTNGDIPVAGDYDGDGKSDVAVWRPSNGTWYYLRSSDGQFAFQQFGANGDVPVQGDYDGDGKTNFAVFRPSTGTWYTSLDPATNFGAVVWGASSDTPVPADYDGDGRTDIAVFRPSNAFWYLLQSAQGYREQQFGITNDTPVPADFDGDGKADFAVFRQATGIWYTSLNPATNYGAIPLGQSGDVPVPGFYDGDGRADAAVFRQGDWYIFQSTNNSVRGVHFGSSGDVPVPKAP